VVYSSFFKLLFLSGSRILAEALAKRGREEIAKLSDISVYHLHVEGADPLEQNDVSPQPFTSRNFFVGKHSRKAVDEGRSTYIPCFLSDIPRLIRHGQPKLDWAFLNVSPPDKQGFCSLGTEVCAALPAAECATKIIAQINPNVPRTHGHSFIHINAFDYVVDVKGHPLSEIPEAPVVAPGEVEMAIGRCIAELIPDGACLQVGIGGIPNAVLACLKDHRHLGIQCVCRELKMILNVY
jgi:acyl-CoA hydrolase